MRTAEGSFPVLLQNRIVQVGAGRVVLILLHELFHHILIAQALQRVRIIAADLCMENSSRFMYVLLPSGLYVVALLLCPVHQLVRPADGLDQRMRLILHRRC